MIAKSDLLKQMAASQAALLETIDEDALRTVTSYAVTVFHPDEVAGWLFAPEPLLGGSTPLNVLKIHGPSRVLAALKARLAGEFA